METNYQRAAMAVDAALADKSAGQPPEVQSLMCRYAREIETGKDAYSVLELHDNDSEHEKAAKRLLSGISGD